VELFPVFSKIKKATESKNRERDYEINAHHHFLLAFKRMTLIILHISSNLSAS